MVKITIEPVNFNASQELIQSVDEMFQNISRYNDSIMSADIYLKSHPETPSSEKEVSINVFIPNQPTVHMSKKASDFKSAAQQLHDQLKSNLRDLKEKHKNRRQERVEKP